MLGGEVVDRFIGEAPVCVMVRVAMENVLAPEAFAELIEQHAEQQHERELLFPSVVDPMSRVVCRVYTSVHAAYQRSQESIPVSVKSLHNKLGGIEPQTPAQSGRHGNRSGL